MRLVIAVVGFAVVLGYLFGGRLRRLEHLRLRWWGLAIGGLGLQFLPLPEGGAGTDLLVRTGVLAISYVLLLLFTFINLRLAGVVVIALGLAGNAFVIVANGGMPVSADALHDSDQDAIVRLLTDQGSDKHHLMDDDDVFTFLADVIPLPSPIAQVISVGDILIYGGLTWLIVWAMRARTPMAGSAGMRPRRGKHRPGATRVAPPPPPPPGPPPAARTWGSGR
jgi:hypothetical protein